MAIVIEQLFCSKIQRQVSIENLTTRYQTWRLIEAVKGYRIHVELYQLYQLGQELMGAEGGVSLLVEMLMHLRSGNR